MDLELMIVHGSQIENFVDLGQYRPYVLYIGDSFDAELLVSKSQLWPPVLTVIDGPVFYKDFSLPHCYLYKWLSTETQSLISDLDPKIDTRVCFNFCVNRMTDSRFLMIKLIEWFGLKCLNYTWSGGKRSIDASRIIADFPRTNALLPDLQKHILSPIELESNFIDAESLRPVRPTPGAFELDEKLDHRSRWQFIHRPLFRQSAVSLINEPYCHEPASQFTEKTIYAMLGLTFPLWPGGYRMAEHWKLIGFDIFDDIIDHSYQYHDTLLDRVYFAFKNNLQLLMDLELVASLRNKHIDRLMLNHTRLQYAITNLLQKQLSLLPPNIFGLLKSHGLI